MDIFTSLHNQQPYHSKVFAEYFGGLNVAVLDIETTGLYPKSDNFILGGLLIPETSSLKVTQYFAESKVQEKELLLTYRNALSKADILISYNGNRFDLPFLNQRCKKYDLNMNTDTIQSFDLYRVLNLYSNFRQFLPNLKQKTVETFLGLSSTRADKISGYESVELYKEYSKTGSTDAKDLILLHNRDDLLQLAGLLCVLNKLDLHKILYHEGFPILYENKRAFIRTIKFNKYSLKATALTRNLSENYYSFNAGYKVVHNKNTQTISVEVPFETLYNANYIDLETIPIDFSPLEKFPTYTNGYLVIRENDQINYAGINYFIKLFLKEIMKYI